MTEEEKLDAELQELIAAADAEETADVEREEEDGGSDEELDTEKLDDNDSNGDNEDDDSLEKENDNSVDEDIEDNAGDDNTVDDLNNAEFEPIEIDVNGTKFTIDSQEELLAFAKKGATPSTPTKVESEYDRIATQGGLSRDDLTLLIDAKNGDVAAVAKLAELAKVDYLDIDEDKAREYTPNFRLEEVNPVEAVADEIMRDTELATNFKQTVGTIPDEAFIEEISTDPDKLKSFAGHVKSGLAQKIIPLATKSKTLNGGSFFDHYVKIGRELYLQEQNVSKPTQQQQPARQVSKREEKLRDRASTGANSSEKPKTGAKEIWEMSDAEFSDYVNRM